MKALFQDKYGTVDDMEIRETDEPTPGADEVLLQIQLTPNRMGLLIVAPTQEDNLQLLKLVESGTLEPVIDRRFPLAAAQDALRRVGEGHALGKVVVEVAA